MKIRSRQGPAVRHPLAVKRRDGFGDSFKCGSQTSFWFGVNFTLRQQPRASHEAQFDARAANVAGKDQFRGCHNFFRYFRQNIFTALPA